MYTANTMSTAIEAMGLSLPGSSSNPAESPAKMRECEQAAAAIQILNGKALYRDVWFDKPPLSALVYLLWDARKKFSGKSSAITWRNVHGACFRKVNASAF